MQRCHPREMGDRNPIPTQFVELHLPAPPRRAAPTRRVLYLMSIKAPQLKIELNTLWAFNAFNPFVPMPPPLGRSQCFLCLQTTLYCLHFKRLMSCESLYIYLRTPSPCFGLICQKMLIDLNYLGSFK